MKKKWFLILGASAVLLGLDHFASAAAALERLATKEFENNGADSIVIDALPDPSKDKSDSSDVPSRHSSRNAKQFLLSHYLFADTYLLPAIAENEVASPSISAFDNKCVTNQGQFGSCESFEKCYPLLNLPEEESSKNVTSNYSDLREEVYQFSVDRKCSSVVNAGPSKFQHVCCDAPQTTVKSVPPPQLFSSPLETEDDLNPAVNPKYSKIVNTWATCGEKLVFDHKIIGGKEAIPYEFPWMISLWGKSGKHICGASLLDNNYVITAAHCISRYTSQDVNKIRLLIGDHDIHSKADGHHEVRGVSRIIRHKRFSLQTFVNDIALLKLDRPVAYSDRIRPICLPTGAQSIEADPHLVVAGWGQTVYKGNSSSKLRKVSVPGVSNQECGRVYNALSPAGITSEMVCAGATGLDSCIGDSGGPLIQLVNNRFEQVGVVSFGRECGNYPGVYTKVHSYLNWINVNRNKY